MSREAVMRFACMCAGIVTLCIAVGIVRSVSELAFPTYSGFRFYQPLFSIPLHAVISFLGMGAAQFLAWASNLLPIRSWSDSLFVGAGYSVATFAALASEKHLPELLGSPGSDQMLVVLLVLSCILCIAVRLVYSVWPLRKPR